MGPLVSDEQFKRVTGYINSGIKEGAEIVTGAKEGLIDRRAAQIGLLTLRVLDCLGDARR